MPFCNLFMERPSYILSRTVFKLSRSICQIIAFNKGIHIVNTLILYNLLEYMYLHRSSIAKKLDSFGGLGHFVANTVGLL